MQNKVTIEPDELGNVIRQSKNNPEYGHVRITQERVAFSATGWVKSSVLSTLIHGTIEDLTAIGIAKQKSLPGQIIVREGTEPFSTNDPDRDLKIAGETGVVCCSHGEPIYRKTFYDASGLQEDSLIPHTNGEDIKEAQGIDSAVENADDSDNAVTISAEELEKIKENIEEEEKEVEEEEETEEVEEQEELEEVEEKDDSFEL